jgi:rsbT co-antagonist protein RsbR
MAAQEKLAGLPARHREKILKQWQRELAALTGRSRLSADETRRQADEFFTAFMNALAAGAGADIDTEEWKPVRIFLEKLSKDRVLAGFSSDETAIFIFSLKRPLFDAVSSEARRSPEQVALDLWAITELLDKLGLHTVKTFQRTREEVINRQQAEMLELSTPVVKLWEGILAVPLIGTLDSARTQVVMESLLQRTVDTLVAQHLLKTVTALRLMGADCIVSGVRPQIAQTIVHLGVDLQGITTKANLADALALALKRTGVPLAV